MGQPFYGLRIETAAKAWEESVQHPEGRASSSESGDRRCSLRSDRRVDGTKIDLKVMLIFIAFNCLRLSFSPLQASHQPSGIPP